MGGEPLFALNLVGFPRDTLPLSILAEIMRGGSDKAAEAGICIIGGHTIDDAEPKYGLVVTGAVSPDRIVRNVGARPGDALYLTKPIGTGILSTAIKRGLAGADEIEQATAVMATLNRAAAEAMVAVGVNAATDVTGFGLLGHLHELARGSGVGAIVEASAVPLLPSVEELANRDVVPGGTQRNAEMVAPYVDFGHIEEALRILLVDAQTSGGLLIAVPTDRAAALEDALRERGAPVAARIGEIVAGDRLRVVS
jgi:selenide,water dikinase